jgi:L-gulonolactone oxidase
MYNIDGDERWSQQVAAFEAFARQHGDRPHWGKESSFDADYLRTQFSKLDEFREVMLDHDPEGKFVNTWVAGLFR